MGGEKNEKMKKTKDSTKAKLKNTPKRKSSTPSSTEAQTIISKYFLPHPPKTAINSESERDNQEVKFKAQPTNQPKMPRSFS